MIAQNDAADLPPEIAPLAAKYQADLATLAQAKSKAMATVRQAYLIALAAAEKTAARNKDHLEKPRRAQGLDRAG